MITQPLSLINSNVHLLHFLYYLSTSNELSLILIKNHLVEQMHFFIVFIKIIILSFSFSNLSFSAEIEKENNSEIETQETENKEKSEHDEQEEEKESEDFVTNNNEDICQKKFLNELLNQNQIFSATDITLKQRRIAERKIEAGRKKHDISGSFCEGYKAMKEYKATSLKRRPGDVQFKGEE